MLVSSEARMTTTFLLVSSETRMTTTFLARVGTALFARNKAVGSTAFALGGASVFLLQRRIVETACRAKNEEE